MGRVVRGLGWLEKRLDEIRKKVGPMPDCNGGIDLGGVSALAALYDRRHFTSKSLDGRAIGN